MAAISIAMPHCSSTPAMAVGAPPVKESLPSRPLAMACMITTGLKPLMREAEPISMVPPMSPASRMAVSTGCLLCMVRSLKGGGSVSAAGRHGFSALGGIQPGAQGDGPDVGVAVVPALHVLHRLLRFRAALGQGRGLAAVAGEMQGALVGGERGVVVEGLAAVPRSGVAERLGHAPAFARGEGDVQVFLV